jgi:uncharacterized Zn finger protein (UPF0148 family)
MICPKCGRKFDDGTVFCTYCGERCIGDLEIQSDANEIEEKKTGGVISLL